MRIVAISDTHGLHGLIDRLPDGDVLVHAGDFMNSGKDLNEIRSFNTWLGDQPFRCRLVCAGNHDRYFESSPLEARSLLTNAKYLENAGVTLEGISFWGSPYTPEFMNWAFMYRRREEARQLWAQIPRNVDVLITHGPPSGILDCTGPDGKHLGCDELFRAVEDKKPKVHIFGHIHGGAGVFSNGTTRFVNAAFLNEGYRPLKPGGRVQIIDL